MTLARDEELLVIQAQEGDLDAMDALIRLYIPGIRSKAGLYFMAGAEREDVMQEGLIGLFKAIRTYEAEKEASFKTYAEVCITHQIISAVKSSKTLKSQPLNDSLSIDFGIENPDGTCVTGDSPFLSSRENPENILIMKEKMQKLEKKKSQIFSEFERKVLLEFLRGKNCAQIGQLMGRTSKSVDNAIQRIKRKLQDILMD